MISTILALSSILFVAFQPFSVESLSFIKPSAHVGGIGGSKSYNKDQVITHFAVTGQSHLAGGMTYSNGVIRIPYDGLYYVYCQMNGYNNPSVKPYVFSVTNKNLDLMRGILPGKHGPNNDFVTSIGGVFRLRTGDQLKVYHRGANGSRYHLDAVWSYFGAYMI